MKLLKPLLVLLILSYALWTSFKWTVMRVYVPPDKALKVINKYGQPLPAELIAVPPDHLEYKGVREELLGPGRYFLDPVRYDWELVPLVKIHAGEPAQWDWDPYGQLKNPDNPVARAIDGSAQVIITAINQVLHDTVPRG